MTGLRLVLPLASAQPKTINLLWRAWPGFPLRFTAGENAGDRLATVPRQATMLSSESKKRLSWPRQLISIS